MSTKADSLEVLRDFMLDHGLSMKDVTAPLGSEGLFSLLLDSLEMEGRMLSDLVEATRLDQVHGGYLVGLRSRREAKTTMFRFWLEDFNRMLEVQDADQG